MFHHQLHPVPEPIGVFQNYVAKVPETLILREKIMSLSGDSFTVTNAAGLPFLKIKGHHVTISGRKSVYDMQDHHLYDLVKELLHLHATYAAEDPSGKKILSVRSSFQLIGSKATGEFTSFDGKTEKLVMKGHWMDTNADIVCERTGATLARIDRKLLKARELLTNNQTYALTIAPGVDMALMVAMCVALDEKNNEGAR